MAKGSHDDHCWETKGNSCMKDLAKWESRPIELELWNGRVSGKANCLGVKRPQPHPSLLPLWAHRCQPQREKGGGYFGRDTVILWEGGLRMDTETHTPISKHGWTSASVGFLGVHQKPMTNKDVPGCKSQCIVKKRETCMFLKTKMEIYFHGCVFRDQVMALLPVP